MEKFKVYKDGNKTFFVDTDNYIFAESLAREASREGHVMTIEENGEPVALFVKKYEITRTARGYSIRKKGKYNRFEYLKSISNGRLIFVCDYTYQKHYKTITGARKALERQFAI